MDLLDTPERWTIIRLATISPPKGKGPARLLFATVTALAPERMPPPPMAGVDRIRVKRSDENIYFRRALLSESEALEWYRSLSDGFPKTPLPTREVDRDEKYDGIEFFVSPLFDEKPWPQMSLPIGEGFFSLPSAENDPAPFIGSMTSCIHRRFSSGAQEFEHFLLDDQACAFIASRMHINFRAYQEYLGSACYVSPQPVIRQIENFITEDTTTGEESLFFRFVPRPGQTVQGLQLTTFDKDMNLLTDFQTVSLPEDGIVQQMKGTCDGEYGYVLRSLEHGILAFSAPAPFLRSINVGVGVADRNQHIIDVPIDDSPGSPRMTYHASRSTLHNTTSVVVNKTESLRYRALRREQHIRRERKLQADTQGQRWFSDDSRIEAMRFFHSLIQGAKKQIIIADPYFSGLQFAQYLYKVSSPEVIVDILTTSKSFKGKSSEEKAAAFSHTIDHLRQTQHITVNTHILPGNLLHDRFVVIDSEVWFSGNSLNSFGKQASVIVKLPDPQPIIDNLKKLKTRGQPIDVYFNVNTGERSDKEDE
ncbi:VPA1262 family N-terminal domain-containing protein [Rahnella perminowiae]|uniref:VPA1262 family N-terminal domain-containing protein n=1 Tax=Rahnella perminowiae TaxID=2816244 RepID=UPI00215D128D|nr:VPA1262 family N-terminal domain-containing protein [Rahnella perminowiae]MCR9000961.1 VPA1262 family N-terminal domain-containing protein [Rahnella perminowiae]